MENAVGWQPGFLWAAVELAPPYRLIGLYHDCAYAVARAVEFGSPSHVQPVPGPQEALCLADTLRRAREGR
jgi:hypothetical protein